MFKMDAITVFRDKFLNQKNFTSNKHRTLMLASTLVDCEI